MDELKSRFDAAVRDIAPPPSDAQRVMTRGRRARVWRGVAGAAMGAGVLAGGLWAVASISSPQQDEIRPTQDDPSFARYEINLGEGFNAAVGYVEGVGFLEVDGRESEICLDAAVKGATSRHLHRRDGGSEVSLPNSSASRSCHIVPEEVARDILGNHEQWYIEFHNHKSGGTIRSDLVPLPQSPAEDRVAGEVVEHLRRHVRLCRGFDFQYKGEIEDKAYRPVQCGAEAEILEDGLPVEAPETPGPIEGDDYESRYLSGPDLVIYGFQDLEARDAWLATQQPGLAGRVYGGQWVIDVMDRDLYRRVVAGAPQGAEEAIAPEDEVAYGDHSLEAVERSRRTKVSLPDAIETAREDEELLIAEPVLYRGPDTEHRRAWHVVLRRCIPSYGGVHAEAECEGDQTHIVIDASSGAVLAEFVT